MSVPKKLTRCHQPAFLKHCFYDIDMMSGLVKKWWLSLIYTSYIRISNKNTLISFIIVFMSYMFFLVGEWPTNAFDGTMMICKFSVCREDTHANVLIWNRNFPSSHTYWNLYYLSETCLHWFLWLIEVIWYNLEIYHYKFRNTWTDNMLNFIEDIDIQKQYICTISWHSKYHI